MTSAPDLEKKRKSYFAPEPFLNEQKGLVNVRYHGLKIK